MGEGGQVVGWGRKNGPDKGRTAGMSAGQRHTAVKQGVCVCVCLSWLGEHQPFPLPAQQLSHVGFLPGPRRELHHQPSCGTGKAVAVTCLSLRSSGQF